MREEFFDFGWAERNTFDMTEFVEDNISAFMDLSSLGIPYTIGL